MIMAQLFNLHIHLNNLLYMRCFDHTSKTVILTIQYLIEFKKVPVFTVLTAVFY